MRGGLLIRRAEVADRPALLSLLSVSLGWVRDEDHDQLFGWKHDQNPFGVSPAWVAIDEDSDAVVGLRTFLRWDFERDGEVVHAVRAVDTATDPAFRGKGIFTALTERALEELKDDGVAFVFNTPNDQSRPGYLKMGWRVVGRVPVAVRARSVGVFPRVLGARQPADLWPQPSDAGEPAGVAIARGDVAVSVRPLDGRLRTRITPEFLLWRYGAFPALGYRALLNDRGDAVLVRLRRRGRATEAAVADIITSDDRASAMAEAASPVARVTGADYAIMAWSRPLARAGFVPLPGQGPVLTWRALGRASCPPIDQWGLVLGDLELF